MVEVRTAAWTLMVLLLWINGYRHDFTTDEGFAVAVGVAAGEIELNGAASLISRHMVTILRGRASIPLPGVGLPSRSWRAW
ncbi:hypothetical protein [Arthrobacter bambusae]|uniref:hypothetical protein n=1 Tax=Arthrobacter bambusae TaxID=1338426 RepID=UPI002784576A|nr:hypothetical protein [Arthrobacter bambusae]MDQ0029047.1 prophage maintenance system killer protein [Arthrobacter bambusae]MDQ0098551.1 prophage maintenance system killer protein [Arthrobacter bambusae]